MPEIPPAVYENPFYVRFALIVGLLVLTAAAWPKIAGPLQEWWRERVLAARRTHTENADAHLANLERQLKGVSDQLQEVLENQAEHAKVLETHRRWDHVTLEKASARGLLLDPPPPLYPISDEAR